MSINTDALQEESKHRLSAFDGMLKHLNVDPGPKSAFLFREELREALKSCTRCRCVRLCDAWRGRERHGTPPFCIGAQAFRDLAQAEIAQGIVTDQHHALEMDTPSPESAPSREGDSAVRLFGGG